MRVRNTDVWEIHQSVASGTPPTGGSAGNPGICSDRELNWWTFDSQASTLSTEPHQSGPYFVVLRVDVVAIFCYTYSFKHCLFWLNYKYNFFKSSNCLLLKYNWLFYLNSVFYNIVKIFSFVLVVLQTS